MSFLEELKRRNVIRVGLAYLVVAWLLAQVAELALDSFNAPDWVIQSILVVLALGLPLALLFAWAFELTPEGIKKEEDVDRSESITPQTGRKLDRAIIALLSVAVVYFAADKFFLRDNASEATTQVTSNATSVAKSIAVLPFADRSQAGDHEWFAEGLGDEILNVLTKTPDLLVASRTLTLQYKGSTLDIKTIADELGVANVLEGSVRTAGDQVRVTARLTRTSESLSQYVQ